MNVRAFSKVLSVLFNITIHSFWILTDKCQSKGVFLDNLEYISTKHQI